MFKGSIPALITPFNNGQIDYLAFDRIIEWSFSQGSHGFVPCGTTGESPTLSHNEHKKVIEECVSLIKNKKDCKKIDFKVSNENAWEIGLACGGDISIYIEEIV